jgi:riboflavin kinase/FMN adenylyltransferase
MRVYKGLEDLPSFKNPVVTIGSFDGVHLGHRKIIEQIITKAKEVNGESVIITFNPHPRLVLHNETKGVSLLSTLDEKIDALEKLNVDVLVVVPFTKTFSEISAQAYIEDFLVANFHPHTLIIGYDHHFGNNRSGNFAMLAEKKIDYHFELEEIAAQEISHIAISSTKIRAALFQGNVKMANEYLCNNYTVFGKVVHGEKKGRLLGFPTANLQVMDYDKLIPAKGVYVVNVKVGAHQYRGMMNIGTRPTITDNDLVSLEVHILKLDQDLYGQYLTVEFLDRIRDEKKFSSLDELITQLTSDKKVAEAY